MLFISLTDLVGSNLLFFFLFLMGLVLCVLLLLLLLTAASLFQFKLFSVLNSLPNLCLCNAVVIMVVTYNLCHLSDSRIMSCYLNPRHRSQDGIRLWTMSALCAHVGCPFECKAFVFDSGGCVE